MPGPTGRAPVAGASPSLAGTQWWLRILVPCLWFAYLAAPGHPLGLLRGIPLDPWGLALGGGLAVALYGWGPPRLGRRLGTIALTLLTLFALKLALWSAAPAYGLAASYYGQPRFAGPPERSTELRSGPSTRIEDGPARPSLGLHFFNDVERFNFYEGSQPDRLALPFAVRWDGFLHVPTDGSYAFLLAADGPAVLALDGRPVSTVPGGGAHEDRATLPLSEGALPLRVEYVHRGGPSPFLRLEWAHPNGGLGPLGAPHLTVEPTDSAALRRDAATAWAARVGDALFLALLLGTWVAAARPRFVVRRLTAERSVLALLLGAVLAYALVSTRDLYERAVILEGGQDWLTYESYARDILLNGPLMTLGKPLGQGRPFFFQPFYPYYLAAMHWLTGEGVWGPTVLQLLGLGVCGVLLHRLAKRLFGAPAAWITLLLFGVLFATQLDWVARKLLSENLYFLLLPGAVLLVIRFLDEGRRRDLVLAGLSLGFAAITRAPTLLYVFPLALLVGLRLRRRGATARSAVGAALILLVLTAVVAAVVPLRNYVVSGRPALVATNGGATLLLAHTPTPKVRLARVNENPLYNALSLDRPTREVLEFLRQDPLGYAVTLVPLALYAIGFSGAVEGTSVVAPEILALTLLYLAALTVVPGARSARAGLLHLFVGIHFLIMVTFLPYVYGYRQVLPMQLLMLPFAGALLAGLARRLPIGPRAAAGLPRMEESAA